MAFPHPIQKHFLHFSQTDTSLLFTQFYSFFYHFNPFKGGHSWLNGLKKIILELMCLCVISLFLIPGNILRSMYSNKLYTKCSPLKKKGGGTFCIVAILKMLRKQQCRWKDSTGRNSRCLNSTKRGMKIKEKTARNLSVNRTFLVNDKCHTVLHCFLHKICTDQIQWNNCTLTLLLISTELKRLNLKSHCIVDTTIAMKTKVSTDV